MTMFPFRRVLSRNAFGVRLLAALLLVAPVAVRANVAVEPTRVVFDGRERSAEVTLMNSGTETATYRIGFRNLRMHADGSFEVIENASPADRPAADMIRYSPREVTVAPGQSQTVRLLLRKPAGLAPGEYRSHLTFTAVPREGVPGVQAVFGISIPVIVREGALGATATLSELRLGGPVDASRPASVELALGRQGDRSIYGDLEVVHTPPGGQPRLIGAVRGLAVYTGLDRRHVRVPLDSLPRGGALTVVFREKPEDGGRVLAEARLAL